MAETKVDMALDDIIKAKKANIRGRGRGGRGARGVARGGRGFSRGASRGFSRGAGGRGNLRGSFKQTRGVSRGGGFRGQSQTRGRGRGTFRGGRGTGQSRGFSRGGAAPQRFTQSAAPMQTGPTKLTITNLEYGVSDSDVKELFQEFGNMRSAAIHYDSKGQSLGTAHVVFARHGDAIKAMKQYNGVHLDGRPMKISVDGQRLQNAVNVAAQRGAFRGTANRRPVKRLSGGPASFRGAARGGAMRGRGNFRGNTRGSFRGTRGTFRGGRGAARGRGGARGGARGGRGGAKKPVNVADLDAELDAYSNQATK